VKKEFIISNCFENSSSSIYFLIFWEGPPGKLAEALSTILLKNGSKYLVIIERKVNSTEHCSKFVCLSEQSERNRPRAPEAKFGCRSETREAQFSAFFRFFPRFSALKGLIAIFVPFMFFVVL
jgi:hypothetical protein